MKWIDLLTFSILKDAKIIAGVNGINREIKAISVYDCVPQDDFFPDEEGTLYITLFEQYRDSPQDIYQWIQYLHNNKVSGICTIDDGLKYLDQQVLEFCNEVGFPIVSLDRDVAYADIIENISVLLYFDDLHLLNEQRLTRILYDKLPAQEFLREIGKINQSFKNLVRVLAVSGEVESEIDRKSMNHIFDQAKQNTYIRYHDIHLFIFTEGEEGSPQKRLDERMAAVGDKLAPAFDHPVFGKGELCEKIHFDRAVESALTALELAAHTGRQSFTYNRMEELTILAPIKDSKEVREFYDAFLERISEYDKSGKKEFIKCIREYVRSRGEYQIVAEKLFQHENTIRYRINKIKSILGLEDDTIKFNELIALFVAIDSLLEP